MDSNSQPYIYGDDIYGDDIYLIINRMWYICFSIASVCFFLFCKFHSVQHIQFTSSVVMGISCTAHLKGIKMKLSLFSQSSIFNQEPVVILTCFINALWP